MTTPWQIFVKKLISPTPIYFALFLNFIFLSPALSLCTKKLRKRKIQGKTTATITCSNLPTLRSSSTVHSSVFPLIIKSVNFSSAERNPSYQAKSDRKRQRLIHSVLMDIQFEIGWGIYHLKWLVPVTSEVQTRPDSTSALALGWSLPIWYLHS